MFYATRGVHWCNKKITMKIEVLIIHSSCYPSKRAYVKLASQVGGEIENSKSLVLHVHKQGTRRVAHTAKSQHGRPCRQTRTHWSMRY